MREYYFPEPSLPEIERDAAYFDTSKYLMEAFSSETRLTVVSDFIEEMNALARAERHGVFSEMSGGISPDQEFDIKDQLRQRHEQINQHEKEDPHYASERKTFLRQYGVRLLTTELNCITPYPDDSSRTKEYDAAIPRARSQVAKKLGEIITTVKVNPRATA